MVRCCHVPQNGKSDQRLSEKGTPLSLMHTSYDRRGVNRKEETCLLNYPSLKCNSKKDAHG